MTWVILLAAVLCAPARAGDEWGTGSILYLSRTVAYVDRGEADGLRPQAELTVFREGRAIGRLVVEYLAQHSAAAQIVSASEELIPGDEVHFLPDPLIPREPAAPHDSTIESPTIALETGEPPVKRHASLSGDEPFRLRGRATLERTSFSDAQESGGDFQQTALTLRLKGTRLWRRPLECVLRLRTTYDQRSREIALGRPPTEWRHRFYELSLTHDDPAWPVRLALGRLFAPLAPGAGAWDGALVEVRLRAHWRLSAFGGGDPELITGEPDFDRRKWGGYVSFLTGEPGRRSYQGTLVWVGQYSRGTASREFLALGHRFSWGPRVAALQNSELDINRGWRKERAGENATLSRLNGDLQYRIRDGLWIDLGYDHYRHVREIETREIPDSLFAGDKRENMHLGARMTAAGGLRLAGRIGYRERVDMKRRPLCVGADLACADLFGSGADLTLRYAFTESRFADTHLASLDLRQSWEPFVHLGLGLGIQSDSGVKNRSSALEGRWLRVDGTMRLAEDLDVRWIYRYATGDIGAGGRLSLQVTQCW